MDGVQTLETFSYCYTCHRVHPYDGYGPGMCIEKGRHSKTPGWDYINHAKLHMKGNSAEMKEDYFYDT